MKTANHRKTHKVFSQKCVIGGILEELQITSALIEIQDHEIIAIHKNSRGKLQEVHNWNEVEDLGDRLLTPTFTNSHTHLCMVGFRGIGGLQSLQENVVENLYFHLESHMEASDVEAFCRIGALEAIMSGTGFCWDHYYHALHNAQAFIDVGLSGAIAPTLQDISGPGKIMLEQAWEHTFELYENPKYRNAGIVPVLGPHATDTVSDALWKRIAETAMVLQIPLHSHIAQSIEEVQRSLEIHNMFPMERMKKLGMLDLPTSRLWVHGLYVSKEEIELLDQHLDYFGHCPASQMQFAFPAHTIPWREANIPIVLGTDSGSCNDTVNVQGELRFFASSDAYGVPQSQEMSDFMQNKNWDTAQNIRSKRQQIFAKRQNHIPPSNLLSSVWSHTANMHPKAKIGGLEVGRWANIAVWDLHHPVFWPGSDIYHTLVYANVSMALCRMMIRGQWTFDGDGYLNHRIGQSFKVQAWREEASSRLDALLQRAKITK